MHKAQTANFTRRPRGSLHKSAWPGKPREPSEHGVVLHSSVLWEERPRLDQREMKASDLQLKTTTSGLKYFVLNEGATKIHPGGISDNEDETQSVMMAWPGYPAVLFLVWRSI